MQVALSLIDFDPSQPRRSVDERTIAELAESIQTHGVLEPVSLRRHPEAAGRYIVNRGERRVRAARRAGLETVPAFLDDRVDPFAQAAENLHRENMSPSTWRCSSRSARGRGIRARRLPAGSTSLDHSSPRPRA